MVSVTCKVKSRDGERIGLPTILSLIPANQYVWTVFDLRGMVGVAPVHSSVDDFERSTSESATGRAFSWPQLQHFASQLEDLSDCAVVAHTAISSFSANEYRAGNFSSAELLIQLFDSTEWSVEVTDSDKFKTLLNAFTRWG